MKDGGPAFPRPRDGRNLGDPGMTLRDYFAGQAMAGMMARDLTGYSWDEIVAKAYHIADKMIWERDEGARA